MVVQATVKLVGLLIIAREVATSGSQAITSSLGEFVIVSGKSSYVVNRPYLLLTQDLLVVATGLLALLAVGLLLTGYERLALRFGTLALVLALTVTNLITFYFNQLYTLLDALGQVALLGIAQWYRWRFLYNQPQPAAPSPGMLAREK
jgi:hypothetical protein